MKHITLTITDDVLEAVEAECRRLAGEVRANPARLRSAAVRSLVLAGAAARAAAEDVRSPQPMVRR